ncbi:MAG: GNAT family N-acetyltransferase [bacterium]|nr:GNAT family N-acetyltransferase [bacterium]
MTDPDAESTTGASDSTESEPARVAAETRITVQDFEGQSLGWLRPVTGEDLEASDLLDTLCAWRNAYREFFVDQSVSSVASTRGWLETVLARPDRVMFLVYDASEQLVGQYGLCEITAESAELDNGILGITGGPPSFFFHVERAVLGFCFGELGLAVARARVLAENVGARWLHRRIGMREIERYAVPSGPAGSPEAREVIVLEISPSDRNV